MQKAAHELMSCEQSARGEERERSEGQSVKDQREEPQTDGEAACDTWSSSYSASREHNELPSQGFMAGWKRK